MGTEENRDPGAYIQELRQDIQNAHQQSPEKVVVQGRVSKTGVWTNLAGSRRAQEALTFIQESDAPLPATKEEKVAALVLTLHSWTRGHTIVLHDKTPPPYARTATCQRTNASTGEAQLEWTLERGDDQYTLVHATRHGGRVAERKEPTPEPTVTPPLRPAPRHWTLYKQLTHASTLAEHSIEPYTDAAYVERMLQDWTKYETEVLEGHTGPPDITPLYHMGQRSARQRHRGAGYDRSNAIPRPLEARPPVRRRLRTCHHERHPRLPQLVHAAEHPPPHPARRPTRVAPYSATRARVLPARRRSHQGRQLYQLSADGAATDTGTIIAPQPNKTPHAPAEQLPTRRTKPDSPQRDRTSQRHCERPTSCQAPHYTPRPG